MKLILTLLFIFCVLSQSSARDFATNSFVILTIDAGNPSIREYDIQGNRIQGVIFTGYKVPSAGSVPRLDSSGALLLIQLYTGTAPNIVGYTYSMSSRAYIVDSTSANTGSDVASYGAAMNGQDVWISYGSSVSYIKRGDSSATTANIVAGEGSASMTSLQWVGTRLYVSVNNVLKYMDPVVKTGTSSLTTLTGASAGQYFYFLKSDVMYMVFGTEIIKYSVSGSQATKLYSTTLTVAADQTLKNVHALDVAGVTYVLTLVEKNAGGAIIYRFNDTGSAFTPSTTVYDGTDSFKMLGPSPKPTCSDGFLNQDETDTDCGGSICSSCANTKACSVNTDCSSGYCTSGKICATPLCNDQVKNGKETDVDCGGSDCSGCAFDKSCKVNSDCKGNFCDALVCVATCTDTTQNQQETDVDCGGPNCNACVDGKKCLNQTDCSSNYCNPNFICSTPSCNDGFLNQDETDIDCGGNTCTTQCEPTKACLVNSDCNSDYCNPLKKCSIPSCIDGWKNQNETDVDCGGICSSCQNGASCIGDLDCVSITCSNYLCVDAPPVALPVSEPVAAPIDGPVSDQSPQSSTPSPPFASSPSTSTQPSSSNQPSASTPVKQTAVSAGAVVEMSLIGLLFGLTVLI